MKYVSRYICYLGIGVLYGSTLGDGNTERNIEGENLLHLRGARQSVQH